MYNQNNQTNQNAPQRGSLVNIFSKSIPANNLLDLSLVKDTSPNLPFYKSKYFMFLSMTAGIQDQNGGRTFDKNSRITIKTDAIKVLAFANGIESMANQNHVIGSYQIFADSSKSQFSGNNGIKIAFITEFEQTDNKGNKKRNVAISFKQGQQMKPVGIFVPPAEALAIAETFKFIAQKCMQLEFESRQLDAGKVVSAPTPQYGSTPNVPNGNTPNQNSGAQYGSTPNDPTGIPTPPNAGFNNGPQQSTNPNISNEDIPF